MCAERRYAECFEDLHVWQEARALVREVYGDFAACRDLAFRDQIQRVSLSVMNNIAEGFERRTRKDFAHFLDLAKGSAGEVCSMAYAAEDLRFLASEMAAGLRESATTLSMGIAVLARHLRQGDATARPATD